MRIAALVVAFVVVASVASAQVAATSSHVLAWDQSDADFESLTYLADINGAAPFVIPSICSADLAPQCRVTIPDLGLPMGSLSTVRLYARREAHGVAMDSAPSDPIDLVRIDGPERPGGGTIVIIIEVGG